MTEIFTGKVFLLVTGASQGIGKQIAITFGSLLESKSHALLLARNAKKLQETIDGLPKSLVASYKSVDFSEPRTADEIQENIIDSLKGEKPENFNQAIIVHSAASATFSQLTNEMTNFSEWQRCFNINTFSPAVLNGIFMKIFNNPNVKKSIINISSYWGTKPDVYVGAYCSAKSANNMFFKVVAAENPEVNVLNYLPGYVETDMVYDVLKNSKNEKLKSELTEMIANKTLITPSQTAQYLVDVLKKQNYKSGDYVDYYKKDVKL